MIKFDNSYIRLPGDFYQKIMPSAGTNPELIAINTELAKELGIEIDHKSDSELAEIFSGKKILNTEPIALAYAGHQFGHFVPQLGDGRAVLLGEVLDQKGQRFDLQLKGSGQTQFSRRGDGRSALGPVIREYLVSEAMYELGIPSTRALAAVLSGEMVMRDGLLPGGIFTRVARSHIRVGTFQFFASRGDIANLKILADYVIDRHYPEAKESDNPTLSLFKMIGIAQARLVSDWMKIGFIHGVMNTDNMSISGQTIDFGPCAFMDEFKNNKVFSSIDHQGRYAYSNQISIALWNLARLAECLIPLISQEENKSIELLNECIQEIKTQFQNEYHSKMISKFGLKTFQKEDHTFIQNWLNHLEKNNLDFTNSFRQFDQLLFGEIKEYYLSRVHEEGLTLAEAKSNADLVNPYVIPRNHQIEKAIERAYQKDFSYFQKVLRAIKNPYRESIENQFLTNPPTPEERVCQTFCGT
ncbi:MAG: YdiU family protein [Bdellovibrio sp.]